MLRKQYANATEEYVVAIYFMNSITHPQVLEISGGSKEYICQARK